MTPPLVQRVLHRIRYAARNDGGFTVVEVVVSLVLFVIVAAAATSAIVNALATSNTTNNRVTATGLAQQALAQARADQAAVIATHDLTSVSGPYTVTRTALVPVNVNGEVCPAGDTISVTVVVTWINGGNRSVRLDTVMAC